MTEITSKPVALQSLALMKVLTVTSYLFYVFKVVGNAGNFDFNNLATLELEVFPSNVYLQNLFGLIVLALTQSG